ncbi:MAG: hypothetical protein ACYCWE_02425 [Eubacteriales bacterium]
MKITIFQGFLFVLGRFLHSFMLLTKNQALAANILYPSVSKLLYEPAVTNDKPPVPVKAEEPDIMPELKLPPPLEIAAYIYIAGIILFAEYKAVMCADYVHSLKPSTFTAGNELT